MELKKTFLMKLTLDSAEDIFQVERHLLEFHFQTQHCHLYLSMKINFTNHKEQISFGLPYYWKN